MYPKLSLLDQIDVKKLIELHITKTKNHGHIDEVLIEYHRHVYEAYSLSFIYRRLRWYWGVLRTIRDILKLIDVKMYLLLLPLTITLMIILAATIGSELLLALISIYLMLLGITEALARLTRKNPLIELFASITWLPAHLIVKSVLAYVVIVTIIKARCKLK